MINQDFKKRWHVAEPIPADIDYSLQIYPSVLRQLLYNRGVTDEKSADQFLNSVGSLYSPLLMKGMDAAVARIWRAIDQHESITVYGDYDVDGVSATALLVQVLKKLGATVEGYIPNRFDEGYGVNKEALSSIAEKGCQLIITVDCGIRSPDEIMFAQQLGIDTIVSDHHEPKGDLPDALAVINPKQSGDTYPEKNLSGVGVAFKIADALLSHRSIKDIQASNWLDYVAIGTVSDIVPLTGENRTIVKAGLKLIRNGQRFCLRSLAGVAGIEDTSKITARDIGFALGPRLNAAGRLESADAAYRLLMSEDHNEIPLLAQKLDNHNRDRQRQTLDTQKKAEELARLDHNDYLIFAVNPDFNVGLVGLAASKLVDSYYRPAIVGKQEGELTRASCRSIREFHITQALDECTDLLVRHGGHAMAAGFTVKNENLPELTHKMHAIAERELASIELTPTINADIEIPLRGLKPEILSYLDNLEPTGMENPEALFVSSGLKVLDKRQIGSDKSHLRLKVNDGMITYDAVAFRKGHLFDKLPGYIDLVYSFERNVYQGRVSLQLNVRDIRPAQA